MQLAEQHIIKRGSQFYSDCDSLCFKSKNLYNSCLYVIREAYIKDKTNLVYKLHGLMKNSEQYAALPAKVSSTVLLMVQKNFKSFFKANADYIKNPQKYKVMPNAPQYLDSKSGRFIASYTNQAISKKVFNSSGKIKLSKSDIEIKTKITDFDLINCVRIIPKLNYYVIEVVYTVPDCKLLDNNNNYYSVDLGVSNLATITSNLKDVCPLIINGKPLKSMNQFYNKKLGYYKSHIDKRGQNKTTKQIAKLHLKRKNKVDNYLHKASKEIVCLCKDNKMNTLIVGKNNEWKQSVSIGKKNNQGFINIPHSRFIQMLKYKCELSGINFILQEESYTSKASFLNLDHIPIYKKTSEKHKFSGYRKSRGIYKIKGKDIIINADVNASYNILRKAIPNTFVNGTEGFRVNPKVITLKK